MQNLPSISIVTCTYKSDKKLFTKVLESIKMQDYPKHLVEHLLMDGGSPDMTIPIAKKYGCKVYSDPRMKEQAEERASMGIIKAKNELIVFLENDNILPTKNWLKEMVQPFIDNKKIICTFSAYNSYEESMSPTTKYCALFGLPDPVVYYLGKSEKIRMDQQKYDKGKIISEKEDYWVVRFDKNNLPTIGDNGHMFRKKIMDKVNEDPNAYVHVDAFFELLEEGYDTYGVIKNSIIHVASQSVSRLVRQRVNTKKKFFDGRRGRRKYLVMDWHSPKDLFNLCKTIFVSLTFIIPLYTAVIGYMKIKEPAWFLHPIACFLAVLGYTKSELQWFFSKK